MDSFTVSTFSPYVGETFCIDPGAAEPIATELIEARELGGPSGQLQRTPFSLVFRGPREILLPQRIYRLEHETLGVLDLFLVPIGPDAHGMRYEAVFA